MPTAIDKSPTSFAQEAHPDEVIVDARGAVQRVTDWANWNGMEWPMIDVVRHPGDQFACDYSTWDGGGSRHVGMFDEATIGLSPEVAAKFRAVFDMRDPTQDDIVALGFGPNVKVTIKG